MSNIIQITDFNAKELDVYARISEVQLLHYYEPKPGLFIAESPKVIERALDAGYIPLSILVESKHLKDQTKDILARYPDLPVYTAPLEVLTQLTGYPLARGLLSAMYRPALPSPEEVCKNARRIAILENVMNPTNIGAIFRSAAALNMDAILLTKGCCDPLYRRAIRVSMGTVFQIPWTFLEKETEDSSGVPLSFLHQLGFQTAAMALRDDTLSIDDPILMQAEKLAIILGTEGEGLEEETITNSNYTIKIPMSHGVDSLNVAAASAVAFWQLGKK